MNTIVKSVVICVLLGLISGCVKKLDYVQTDQLSPEKILTIQKGTTTKSDIVRIFGQPYNVVDLDTKETLFYKDENLKALWIELGEDKKVTAYKYSKK